MENHSGSSFKPYQTLFFIKYPKNCRTSAIGIFSFNYAYAPSYVAWYRAMQQLKLSPKEADALLWKMNEKMLLTVPKSLLHAVGKSYLNGSSKKAEQHLQRQNHPIFQKMTG